MFTKLNITVTHMVFSILITIDNLSRPEKMHGMSTQNLVKRVLCRILTALVVFSSSVLTRVLSQFLHLCLCLLLNLSSAFYISTCVYIHYTTRWHKISSKWLVCSYVYSVNKQYLYDSGTLTQFESIWQVTWKRAIWHILLIV